MVKWRKHTTFDVSVMVVVPKILNHSPKILHFYRLSMMVFELRDIKYNIEM